jgi:O-antigen ligase
MRSPMSAASRFSSSGSDRYRGYVWLILAILALAPIPLGSTPPLAWTVWGIVVGVAAVVAAVKGILTQQGTSQLSWPLVSGQLGLAVVCTYLVLQVLPVSGLFGTFGLSVSDGTILNMQTISVSPGDTILMLVRMQTFGILLTLSTWAARSDRSRGLLLDGIVIIITLHALYGLLALFQFGDTTLGTEKTKYIGVATGTFLNRNTFATMLAIGVAIAATCAMRSIVRPTRDGVHLTYDVKTILYIVAAILMITTVVTTQSRAGLAVTVVGIAVVVIATVATNISALRPVLFATPILLIVLAVMFLQLGEDVWLRYETVDRAFDFRFELHREVLRLIAERPFLGFGGGSFELAFTTVHKSNLSNELTWNEAHNTYLELWADLGVIVGSIPILLVACLFILLIVRLAQGKGSWAGQTAALATIAIVGIHSLFDFSLEIEAVALLFATICGVGVAATNAHRKRE